MGIFTACLGQDARPAAVKNSTPALQPLHHDPATHGPALPGTKQQLNSDGHVQPAGVKVQVHGTQPSTPVAAEKSAYIRTRGLEDSAAASTSASTSLHQSSLPTACAVLASSTGKPVGGVLPVIVSNALGSMVADSHVGVSVVKVSFVAIDLLSAAFPIASSLLASFRQALEQDDYLEDAERPSRLSSTAGYGRSHDSQQAIRKLFSDQGGSHPQLETVHIDPTCKVC